MKVFIKALVTGTLSAVLVLVGTGMAHADKGGSKGGSSGGSAKVGSSTAGSGMKMSQGSNQQLAKTSNSTNLNKTNVAQNQQSTAKKVGSNTVNSNVAKTNSVNKSVNSFNKMPQQQSFSKNFYCGTPWSKGCFPTSYNCGWNYCGFGFGYNSCWNYPWYRNYCYTPCYSYPVYDYCCTTPLVYTYQSQVIVTTKVIEVIQQPAPVVETVTTQTTATSTAIKPPAHDVSFLTGSATRPQ